MVPSGYDPASPSSLGSEFEAAIAGFEEEWLAGLAPRIEDYLPSGASPPGLLRELIVAEMEFRRKAGADPRVEEYITRFEQLGANRQLALDLAIEEFRQRQVKEPALDLSQFLGRFPSLEPDLEQALRKFRTKEGAELNPTATASATVHYTDLQWLARGGMGEVWIANDCVLNRPVAMKVIQSKYQDNSEARQRFLDEAAITSRLEHTGIAPVYGLGVYSDGRPCYAMRYIRGESLGDAIGKFFNRESVLAESRVTSIEGGVDPVRDAQSVGIQRHALDLQERERKLIFRGLLQNFVAVCHTVAYAHEHGVLHRDIKPENIRLGDHGEVILLDWGLAKDFASPISMEETVGRQVAGRPGELLKTRIGSIYGTPQFMSPEQARGDGKPLTSSADIYGLGATLYYLTTGKPPFPRESASRIVERVLVGDFEAPAKVCRDLPAALNAICLKAMHTSSERRYGSASELARDIERYLADEPVSVFRDPVATRTRRWLLKHKATTSVAITGIFAVGTILFLWNIISTQNALALQSKNEQLVIANAKANEARDEAQKQRDAATARSQQVLGLAQSLVTLVSVTGPEGIRIDAGGNFSTGTTNSFSSAEYLDRVVMKLDENFPQDDPVRGSILAAVGKTKRSIGLFESSVPLLEQALKIRQERHGPLDAEAAGIEFDLAWCLIELQGKAEDAIGHFRNVIKVRQQILPRDEKAISLAQLGLVVSLFTDRRPQWQIAIEVTPDLMQFGDKTPVNLWETYTKFKAADLARSRRDWKSADLLFGEVSAGIEKILPANHPLLAARDFMLAGYLRDRGDLQQAEVLAFQALRTYRENIGTHTYMCEPLQQLAVLRQSQKEYVDAENLHREAYWLAGLNSRTRRETRGLTRQGLFSCLLALGKQAQLLELIENELNAAERPSQSDLKQLMSYRILTWMDAGDFGRVVSELSEAVPSNYDFNVNRMHAQALLELNRADEASLISPIPSLIVDSDLAWTASSGRQTLLQRLERLESRGLDELMAQVPSDPSERDTSFGAQMLRSLALKQIEIGRFDDAMENLDEASETAARRCSLKDSMTLDLRLDKIVVLMAKGNLQQSMAELDVLVDGVQLRYGSESLATADFCYFAGIIAQAAGSLDKSRVFFDTALRLRQTRWNLSHAKIWQLILGAIQSTSNHKDRLQFIQTQLRRGISEGLSEWRTSVLFRESGAAARQAGELGDAERWLLSAWELASPVFHEDQEFLKSIAKELVLVYEATNEFEKAAVWQKRS